MAAVDAALADYIKTYAALLSMVNGRVYPVLAPQQAVMPFVVYQEITYRSEHHMGGAADLKNVWYQWDVFAERHQQVRDVGEALTTALDGYSGTVNGVDIRAVFVRDRRVSLENEQAGGQQMLYRVSLDTEIWYLS